MSELDKTSYHFHKDCKYYQQCTEQVICEGKSKKVKFTCPMHKYPQMYYLNDIHTIKWDCSKFEPYQDNLLKLLS